MMRPWLAAIGAGRWQLSGIKAARKRAFQSWHSTPTAMHQGFRWPIAGPWSTSEVRGGQQSASAKEKIRPSGAIAFSNEAGVLAAAALRDAFDLVGPRSEVAHYLTDKHMQRKLWSNARLPCPKWVCVETASEANEAIRGMGGRIILSRRLGG